MTQNTLEGFHLLTEEQYKAMQSHDPNDIFAVQMPSITPGEIIVKAFQGDMPATLTEPQKAAARAFFGAGVPYDGVKIVSADPTLQQASMVDGELLDIHIETIIIDGTTYKVICTD